MKKDHRRLRRRPLFTPLLAPVLGGIIVLMVAGLFWTAQSQTTVILVRHADVIQSEGGNPQLTPTGQFRSKALAGWLKAAELSAIYVSDYAPTALTAAPIVENSGTQPIEIPSAEVGRLINALGRHRGETVLVIAEAETLPAIIDRLAGREISVGDDDFSQLYIVTDSILTKARLLQLRYGG